MVTAKSDLPKNGKLEPFMPTSQAFTNRIYSSPMPTIPYNDHIRNTNLSAVNHHLGSAQQNKRGSSSNKIEEVGTAASSRWNPTPEQLYGLEEIYRSGTRTPSANQLQQIALKLRRFGKIEGKNVFYWFQNHRARERQKRRRQQLLNSSSLTEQPLRVNIESLQRKLSGLSRTGFEVGQTKNRVTLSNSSTVSEESVSMPTAVAVAVSKTDERIQFEATESQQKFSTSCGTSAKHAMKQMVEFSTTTTTKVPNLNILLEPNRDTNAKNSEDEREYQTLELFPLSIGDSDYQKIELAKNDAEGRPVTNNNNKVAPIQFFEFLPLKK